MLYIVHGCIYLPKVLLSTVERIFSVSMEDWSVRNITDIIDRITGNGIYSCELYVK